MNGRSILSVIFCAGITCTIDVTPRINAMFEILDPTTLPMAMPELPIQADCAETNSSGIEVPKPTTVRPMTISLSFARLAMATEPSTR